MLVKSGSKIWTASVFPSGGKIETKRSPIAETNRTAAKVPKTISHIMSVTR